MEKVKKSRTNVKDILKPLLLKLLRRIFEMEDKSAVAR